MSIKGKRNLSVVARNVADGFYYSGIITTSISEEEENVLIKFHGNKLQNVHVPVKHVIVVGGAVPCPELQIWDYVLVRNRCPGCSIDGKECYMPGRVRFLCVDPRRNNKLYTIELYTLEMVDETRKYIVTIDKKKYREIVKYIISISGKDVPEPERVVTPNQNNGKVDKDDKSTMTDPVVPPPIKPKKRRADAETQTNNPPIIMPQEPEENVLARSQDDGWYYFCLIVTTDENGYVRVLVSTGDEERIKLEDIIFNANNGRIQVGDKVIALHPKYVYSYAPATVLDVCNDDYLVKFYDKKKATLPRSEVRKISKRKYRKDVNYIKSLHVSGRVVARDDADGIYRPYISKGIDHRTQQVLLKTPNEKQLKQSAIHVFSIDMPSQEANQKWQYVIGPLDQTCTNYLPAEIVSRRPLQLFFCNGMQSSLTNLSQCFYINEDYYRNAAIFFNSKVLKTPDDME